MNEQQDQSYYEIALTNRQVMSIFVVLLVSVLAAFLGGVWLGRSAEAEVAVASAQSITAGVTGGEAPLEELDFFARSNEPAALADTTTSPEGDAAEDPAPPESESEASGEMPTPPRQNAEDKPETASVENTARQEPVKPATRGAGSGAQPPAQAPRGVEAAGKSPGAATVPDFVVIQVFSSNDEAHARRVVNQLRKGGYPAILSPVEVDGRTLHRVRIGPYTDRDEAQVVAQSVERAFKLDTWITN